MAAKQPRKRAVKEEQPAPATEPAPAEKPTPPKPAVVRVQRIDH
jgi:hypothetical protein